MKVAARFVWCLCALSFASTALATPWYSVTAQRLNDQKPVISSRHINSSVFTYNYNAAWLPLTGKDAVMVRCRNGTSGSAVGGQCDNPVGPSVLAITRRMAFDKNADVSFYPINASSVVLEPSSPKDNYGVEDPRVVLNPHDQTYYLLYTAAAQSSQGVVTPRLALATSKTPEVAASWVRHGPVFKDSDAPNSKSGAMLVMPPQQGSFLFWGDSGVVPGLQMATTVDPGNLLNWTYHPDVWLPVRDSRSYFDSRLVEAGPMPLPLSDGNYLFLYNSARWVNDGVDGDPFTQYNVGWVILDQHDPTRILQRSEEPILSPETAWERGDAPDLCLVPNVVFVEGWQPMPGEPDHFLIYYGGADSVLGAARIIVHMD